MIRDIALEMCTYKDPMLALAISHSWTFLGRKAVPVFSRGYFGVGTGQCR